MDPESTWRAIVAEWLPLVFPMLADHAQRLGQGERGVLVLTVDADDMTAMLRAPAGSTVAYRLDPSWLPAAAFVEAVTGPKGMDPTTAARWTTLIGVMDPAHDVALFLASTPDATGAWDSRFLITHDGRAIVH